MSNIYIQEPPTEGKVLLVTSAGDFDIELWSKEAPKACRNFVQLCMEQYYNETIFHRVVPGFIAQGGDPTGTGTGGESIYGKTFKDEFHTRLRFVRRGLVAMANAGPNDNGSQFFFTLGPCQELQNKHTIFAKISGTTIYNLPRFEEGTIDKDDRPEYPHKVLSTKVLNNPFPDIEPRVTRSHKIENEVESESKVKKKGKKDFKLLSFGDEAEEDEVEFIEASKSFSKDINSAHDFDADPNLLAASAEIEVERQEELNRIREKLTKEKKVIEEAIQEEEIHQKEENFENIGKNKKRGEVRAEIKKLKRELQGNNKEEEEEADDENPNKKQKISSVLQQYQEDNAKYAEAQKVLPKKGTSRESQTLALLARFSNKIKKLKTEESVEEEKEDEDDENWLSHRLVFENEGPVMAKDANKKDDDWYEITDPRNALNKRRREKSRKT